MMYIYHQYLINRAYFKQRHPHERRCLQVERLYARTYVGLQRFRDAFPVMNFERYTGMYNLPWISINEVKRGSQYLMPANELNKYGFKECRLKMAIYFNNIGHIEICIGTAITFPEDPCLA